MAYKTVITETDDAVGLIRLNRPEALNALNVELVYELNSALDEFEGDSAIAAMIITGSERAFAVGADIKEIAGKGFEDVFVNDFITAWERVARCRKPVIAAVAGFALGGGCELAMMCDFIIAADTARFGQPELKIGVMPGSGGTQRLARAVGKAKAMDLCLTGRMMDASEAERCGLAARVVAAGALIEEAKLAARAIAAYGRIAAMACKEAINVSQESGLSEGVRFERRIFQALFATQDQKEGMAAFLEKRPPRFGAKFSSEE